ncbi:MAG: 4Fe-4S dicluster domain-containing protein [Terracidiphilus sp.]|jgi:polyferredoxin
MKNERAAIIDEEDSGNDSGSSHAKHAEPGRLKKLRVPAALLLIFWAIAITLWRRTGAIFFLFDIGYIGTSLGVGTGLYALLPRQKRPIGRRLAQFLIGIYMVGFLGLFVLQNMQLEGLFFFVCTGVFSGAIIHYSIAKIFGPLIFGRGFCGWACWTAMVLDLLPFDRSKGWLPGPWKWMRYAHFALSLGLVAGLVFIFGYRPQHLAPLSWLLAGNLLYYAAGILLAYLLKDNRAFCKYLCPVPVLMKLGSRFALLKISKESESCNQCMACVKVCPMDIRIPDYLAAGQRVLSIECILCQTCVSACPTQTLASSWGFDIGGRERLQMRPSISKEKRIA